MPDVTLRKIDKSNWVTATKLTVTDIQKNFVANNSKSLLQSAYEAPERSIPYGVYDGDTMVGFLLVTSDDETPDTYWIWRFMIGVEHQGKGYGKAGMNKIIEQTKAEGKYDYLRLSYVPSNEVAQKLYARVGFVEEGIKEEWGEMVARYDLK
ncbi:MAG: GNAT family N-acetyltransferase [Phototrophicaceae bacterium]